MEKLAGFVGLDLANSTTDDADPEFGAIRSILLQLAENTNRQRVSETRKRYVESSTVLRATSTHSYFMTLSASLTTRFSMYAVVDLIMIGGGIRRNSSFNIAEFLASTPDDAIFPHDFPSDREFIHISPVTPRFCLPAFTYVSFVKCSWASG